MHACGKMCSGHMKAALACALLNLNLSLKHVNHTTKLEAKLTKSNNLPTCSEYLLVGEWVFDAIAQLRFVTFAAREGDVGKQMEHFAGRRRRGARRLQSVAPL